MVCSYIQCVTQVAGRKRTPLPEETLNGLKNSGVLNVPGSYANTKNKNNKPRTYASLTKYVAKFPPKKGGKTHKNRTKRNHKVKRKNKTIKSKTSKTRVS